MKNAKDVNLVTETKNWYSDRFEAVAIQRNILLLFLLLFTIIIIFCIFLIKEVTISKTVEPFVIEIEEKSGLTNVVNPTANKYLTTNEALNRHFIVRYITARETYDSNYYKYNYDILTKLFSSNGVYSSFRRSLYDSDGPFTLYGKQQIKTDIKFRSIQFMPDGKTVQVRFTISEDAPQGRKFNKIATLTYEYKQLEMSVNDRYINPLGFTITAYRVDNEVL